MSRSPESYRVVIPYLPIARPEIAHHESFLHDWWMDAIAMLGESIRKSCGPVPVEVLTSDECRTTFPIVTRHVPTVERRLMLWTLDACGAYLESSGFDRDTVMLDADQLVCGDLSKWFARDVDLGVLVRRPPKDGPGWPVINGVQFWSVRAKKPLAAFYREALRAAHRLPEEKKAWGADTIALGDLLAPVAPCYCERRGLRVAMISEHKVSHAFSGEQRVQLEGGRLHRPILYPVIDFRNYRKRWMKDAFQTLFRR